MRYLTSLTLLSVAGSTLAQNMSICDKYTTALLMNNTAANQYTLLTLLVNTVVIGNYTMPNMNAVPGILAPGEYEGEEVNLIGYFDGSLNSTNRGGDMGSNVNFLDGGGAMPLMENMAANSTTSNQYFLLTHLYQFFGKLLDCSEYGEMDFPKYSGRDMASSHKFMDLTPSEVGYFISQVGLAATSFGVSTEDVTTVATALQTLFGYRCSPATTAIPEMGPTLNSICQNEMCPLDPMADCAAYPNNGTVMEPVENGHMGMNGTGMPTMSGTGMPTMTTSAMATFTGGAGMVSAFGLGPIVGGVVLALAL